MGAAVSGWNLARTVSRMGQLGVVSGTGIDLVLARRLQDGDAGGHLHRALARFPVREITQGILNRYYVPGGKSPSDPYRRIPMHTASPGRALQQLAVVANFAEVFLAKEGHDGLVGINFLEKIQLPVLPSLYGAMLAGVDFVLMGAGIPREVPAVLDRLADHEDVCVSLHLEGASSDDAFKLRFNPCDVVGELPPALHRPRFIAIVASTVLAATMAKKSTGQVDGFVIEGPTAGGHNAPPRGTLTLNERGEPRYGPRDDVDLEAIRRLGLPFWLAGSFGSPQKLKQALDLGAAGIQVGTAFAFCRESGLSEEIKRQVLQKVCRGDADVLTDPVASPTGFPFKVVALEGTLSRQDVYEARARNCDLGYLRHVYKAGDRRLGYRCPAEPVEHYVKKGGAVEDTAGRRCLCNALMANIGLAQRRDGGYDEKPLVTAGDDLVSLAPFVQPCEEGYSARDVIRYLQGERQRIAGDIPV